MRSTIQPPTGEPPPVIMPLAGPPAAAHRPPPAAPPAPAGRRWRGELLRLLLELPLVFLSVYLAFLATGYQEGREREARRAQLRGALRAEVADIGRNTAAASRSIAALLQRYDSAAAAGQPMPLQPILEGASVQPHMWQTALAGGGIDLFEIETMVRLSEFYNSLGLGMQQFTQVRDLSERYLLPVAGAPAATFWLPDGTVRPQYAWYFATLRRLGASAGQLSRKADSLLVALEAEDARVAGR